MKIKIELKPVDADGLGGQILEQLGMKRDVAQPCCFIGKVVAEEDDEVLDVDGAARPFVEALMDEGIHPRRVQTMSAPTSTVTIATAVKSAMTAVSAARKVLASPPGVLNAQMKAKANDALVNAGFDGNKRFRKVGEALSAAFNVLASFGIEPETTLNAHLFSAANGVRPLDLALTNPEDSFSPTSITNSMLHFQWATMDNGVVEVVAYLS